MATMTTTRPTAARLRHDRNRKEMYDTILAAAQRQLAEAGLAKFSLRGVARAIGYSPAALYEYFPSKELLLETVYFQGDGGLRDIMIATIRALPEDAPFPEIFSALAHAYRKNGLAHPDLFHYTFSLTSLTDFRLAKESVMALCGTESETIATFLTGQASSNLRQGIEVEDLSAFDVLCMVVGHGCAIGALIGDPFEIAIAALSTVHGFLTIELAGTIDLMARIRTDQGPDTQATDQVDTQAVLDAWFDATLDRFFASVGAPPHPPLVSAAHPARPD